MECDFQRDLIADQLNTFNTVGIKLDPGTGSIPKGWPDLMLLHQGGVVTFCEVKDHGGTVSPQQRRHMLLLCLSGHRVCFADPRPEFCHVRNFSEEEVRGYQPPPRRP